MTEQNFDINKLRVASPCSASWAAMAGDDRKRFCDLCNLSVYNFSEMTAEEVRVLIAGSEGRICGRLYKRADGTLLTKDCPVGLRAYQKRAARFAGAALATILGLFSVSFGQKTDEKPVEEFRNKIVRTASSENVLSGTLFDSTGAVIPNAEITIYKNGDFKLTFKSDAEGFYKSPPLPAGIYNLEARLKSLFYRTSELEIKNNEQIKFDITLEPDDVMMGDVVMIDTRDLPREENLRLKNLKSKKPKKIKD